MPPWLSFCGDRQALLITIVILVQMKNIFSRRTLYNLCNFTLERHLHRHFVTFAFKVIVTITYTTNSSFCYGSHRKEDNKIRICRARKPFREDVFPKRRTRNFREDNK